MMDLPFANYVLPPRQPSDQTYSQILPPSSIQQPTLDDQFSGGSLQILRSEELPINQTFSPLHEATLNHSQPHQPTIEWKMSPYGPTYQIPPSAPTQLAPTFLPPFVPPSHDYTIRRSQCERMLEMNSRLQPPHFSQHASPDFRPDTIRPRSYYGSSWRDQNRSKLEYHWSSQTFSPLHTSPPLRQQRRLRAPTTIPTSSPHISFPQNYPIDRLSSAMSSRFIPCSWETTSRRVQTEQPQHHHLGVDLLPSENPVMSTRVPHVCAGGALEGSLLLPRTLPWPPAYPIGYCSDPFSNSGRTSRSFPENKKMSRIIEDEESEEDLEPINEIDSESSLRDRLPDLNELALPDVVLGAMSSATNDEANETQETKPSMSRNVTTGKSSTHLAGQGQKPTATRSLAKVDSQKSSPSQKAPEISLDEDYLESSFHQHEQVIAHQREVLQDLSLCEWPMDVEPALRQEMAWEALRRQPPPSQDLLNDMHFDDPHRLYWRVPSIPEQLNLISDDVEESPPEPPSPARPRPLRRIRPRPRLHRRLHRRPQPRSRPRTPLPAAPSQKGVLRVPPGARKFPVARNPHQLRDILEMMAPSLDIEELQGYTGYTFTSIGEFPEKSSHSLATRKVLKLFKNISSNCLCCISAHSRETSPMCSRSGSLQLNF